MTLSTPPLLIVMVALLHTTPGGRIVAAAPQAGSPAGEWLARPVSGWNKLGAPLPKAPIDSATRNRILRRCELTLLKSSASERALVEAGWIAFLNFDQKLVQADVEIVNGMTTADGMCRPDGYNIFVFVAGQYAGALSPVPMTSRADGSSGAVRILGPNSVSAEFVRYTEKDPLCCPSSRVTVRYEINRSGPQPVVVPVEIRTTRQQ